MDPLFQVHRLNDEGQAKAGSVAKAFNELLKLLREKIAPNRERAICEMKLEEACFFAKKAIANDPGNRIQKALPQRAQRTTEKRILRQRTN